MGVVDFILNLAGLLLWLNWRSVRFDPLGKRTPATLIGTLRRAEPRRLHRWHLLAILGALLVLRAVGYWQIGSATNWAGRLNLGVMLLSFPSNLSGTSISLLRMLVFSTLSFVVTLVAFYLCLLLFSILRGPEPFHRLVRMQLGPVDRWPLGIKIIIPFVVTAAFWWLASWPLTWLAVIPSPVSAMHRVEESLVIGLGSYLTWELAAVALLVLHLLNSYIYFGGHPFWKYVTAEAQTLLRPLRILPLRLGKADFAPVLGIALVILIAEFAERGLTALYLKLPF